MHGQQLHRPAGSISQYVLIAARPKCIPPNTLNPKFSAQLVQAFRVSSSHQSSCSISSAQFLSSIWTLSLANAGLCQQDPVQPPKGCLA